MKGARLKSMKVDFEDENDEHLEDNFPLNVHDEEEPVLAPKINSVVKKVRVIVNMLNRHVVIETCWFLLLQRAISKALVGLSGEMNINEAELKLLEDLICTLELIKVVVEALCT